MFTQMDLELLLEVLMRKFESGAPNQSSIQPQSFQTDLQSRYVP